MLADRYIEDEQTHYNHTNTSLLKRSPMETSKRQGIFHITNLAFKLYFKLNNVRMCQTMISNIRTGGVDLDEFPISEQVTYKYYLGRYSLFHGRLKLVSCFMQLVNVYADVFFFLRLKSVCSLPFKNAIKIIGITKG